MKSLANVLPHNSNHPKCRLEWSLFSIELDLCDKDHFKIMLVEFGKKKLHLLKNLEENEIISYR